MPIAGTWAPEEGRHMRRTTDGLIIREQAIGERDRLVTVLTREMGVIRAFVRGAKNIKSRMASSTGLLCYSRLSIYEGKDKYIIEDAVPIEVFFQLRDDIVKLSLAQYFLELDYELAPKEERAEDCLRLTLNALHMLASGKMEPAAVKPVVELRLLSYAGYMPDVVACCSCGEYLTDRMFFLPSEGHLYCMNCVYPAGCVGLSSGAVQAMRHIVFSEPGRMFFFRLADASLRDLGEASEKYLLEQTHRKYKTLDFYHTMVIT